MNIIRLTIIFVALTIFMGCGQEEMVEGEHSQGASTVLVDNVVGTVAKVEPQDIETSPLFTLQWKSSHGRPAKPMDYPIGSILSRIRSRELFILINTEDVLRLINPKTGLEKSELKLPESILQTHRRLGGDPGFWGDFSYATCRFKGNTYLLVKATQSERRGPEGGPTTRGSGIGTALYCCTLDGKVLWTFLGELTHTICVIPIDDKTDVIVLAQGSDQIVLLSVTGKEIGRIETPTFDRIEINVETDDRFTNFLFIAGDIYSYALENNFLIKHQEKEYVKTSK